MATTTTDPQVRTPEEQPQTSPAGRFEIAGIPVIYFAVVLAILAVATYSDNLPQTMLVGFFAVIVVGGLVNWLGEQVPFCLLYTSPSPRDS